MPRFEEQERVVWRGCVHDEPDEASMPAGSSGKLRESKQDRSGRWWHFVSWGEGFEGWYPDEALVSVPEAKVLGIWGR